MRNYWWLEVTKDVGEYIEKYNLCQRMKNRTETPAGKLIINEILEKSWTYLIMDFITKLLLVVEENVILVACNQLLKIAHFVATTEEISAKRLTQLFRDNVYKLHGLLVMATNSHKDQ